MDWITEQVGIGNHLEAQDVALLKQHGFRSVLSLDGTLSAQQAVKLGLTEVIPYRLVDGAGNELRVFRSAVRDLRRLATSLAPVLVHCHAGRSRSAVVVAGYLTLLRSIEPEEAVAAVAAKREINVTPALLELLYKLKE
jgi:protein-tyrosine phosphatase